MFTNVYQAKRWTGFDYPRHEKLNQPWLLTHFPPKHIADASPALPWFGAPEQGPLTSSREEPVTAGRQCKVILNFKRRGGRLCRVYWNMPGTEYARHVFYDPEGWPAGHLCGQSSLCEAIGAMGFRRVEYSTCRAASMEVPVRQPNARPEIKRLYQYITIELQQNPCIVPLFAR